RRRRAAAPLRPLMVAMPLHWPPTMPLGRNTLPHILSVVLWRNSLMSAGTSFQEINEATAIHLARELYGLPATALSLPGEYHNNFDLMGTAGEQYVLKIMAPGYRDDLLDLQICALEHLGSRAPGLSLPRVCPTSAGSPTARVVAGDGQARQVWLLSFIPGQ